MDILKQVGVAITELPPSFSPHRQIKKVYEGRRAMIDSGGGGNGNVCVGVNLGGPHESVRMRYVPLPATLLTPPLPLLCCLCFSQATASTGAWPRRWPMQR